MEVGVSVWFERDNRISYYCEFGHRIGIPDGVEYGVAASVTMPARGEWVVLVAVETPKGNEGYPGILLVYGGYLVRGDERGELIDEIIKYRREGVTEAEARRLAGQMDTVQLRGLLLKLGIRKGDDE